MEQAVDKQVTDGKRGRCLFADEYFARGFGKRKRENV